MQKMNSSDDSTLFSIYSKHFIFKGYHESQEAIMVIDPALGKIVSITKLKNAYPIELEQ